MSGGRECAQNVPGERGAEGGASAVHIKNIEIPIAEITSRRPSLYGFPRTPHYPQFDESTVRVRP
jgi:hypothetical protein